MNYASINRDIANALTPQQREDLLADVICVHAAGGLLAYGTKVKWLSMTPVDRLLADGVAKTTPKIELAYTPAVGDKVTLPTWEPDRYVDVEWVGDKTFAGTRSSDGARTTYSCNDVKWQLWVEPKPKQYIVELRTPKVGEAFFFQPDYTRSTHVISAASPSAGSVRDGRARPVIVGEQ